MKPEGITIQPDYVNGQFNIWQGNQLIDVKLPAVVQKEMIRQIASDICQEITYQIKHQLHDEPPGLRELIHN